MVKTNEEKIFSIREQPNDLAQIKKNLHHPWTKSTNEDQSGVVLLSTSFETENIVCVRTVRTGSMVVCRRRSMTRNQDEYQFRWRIFSSTWTYLQKDVRLHPDRIWIRFAAPGKTDIARGRCVGRPYTNQDRRPKSSPSLKIGSRLIECKLNLQGLKAVVLHLILRDHGLRVVFGHYT